MPCKTQMIQCKSIICLTCEPFRCLDYSIATRKTTRLILSSDYQYHTGIVCSSTRITNDHAARVAYCGSFHCSWGSTLQYSTVQYNIIQYSTVQYSTVQYSTKHSTIQCSTVQYSTLVQCRTVQYSTVQYSTVQYVRTVYEFHSLPRQAGLLCVADNAVSAICFRHVFP